MIVGIWEHATSKPHHHVQGASATAEISPLALASGERGRVDGELADEIRRLETVRAQWLDTPDVMDLNGRTPRSVIERERQRLPEGGSGAEAMVDPDCPCCQMMAEDDGVYFWGLDGCNMDDDFAFDYHYRTREEWDQDQQKREKWDREFEERQRARAAAGESGSVWQSSYVNPEFAGSSVGMRLFGLASHLAELTQNLKDAAAEQQVIDDLNRVFGNLRDAAQDPSAALVEPVIERLAEHLAAVVVTHPDLVVKCDDLERQLRAFGRRLIEGPGEDEDIPF